VENWETIGKNVNFESYACTAILQAYIFMSTENWLVTQARRHKSSSGEEV